MRLATWNVERLSHLRDVDQIIEECEKLEADILVLTETDERIKLRYKYCYKTSPLQNTLYSNSQGSVTYRDSERRVAIYTNYELIREYETYDQQTTRCVELNTDRRNLIVYGTIMGVFGNRHFSYQEELEKQIKDFEKLCATSAPLCVIGDYNCSFNDNYYYTTKGRSAYQSFCDKHKMNIVTGNVANNIDHITLSESMVQDKKIVLAEMNEDKRLSDHKGIMIEI